MATSSARGLILALASLLLTACTQTITSSTVRVDESYLSDSRRGELVKRVYEKASDHGGDCKLVSEARQYHVCSLADGNPHVELSVGYNPGGHFIISTSSTLVHWFPPTTKKVTSGAYLPALQRDLEAWMLSLLPKDAILEATRTYVGYGVSREF